MFVEKLARVKMLVCDVDGTLTDGGILYGTDGHEYKRFDVKDGLGIVTARLSGIGVSWISGRQSYVVERRAKELGVHPLLQGVRNKADALRSVSVEQQIHLEEIAFMGDDWNDLPAMRLAGCVLAPRDAVREVIEVADWISEFDGGHGAVRDAITAILKAQGRYDKAVADVVASLTAPVMPTSESDR